MNALLASLFHGFSPLTNQELDTVLVSVNIVWILQKHNESADLFNLDLEHVS
jgi:AMMECR1 domain-containing protein